MLRTCKLLLAALAFLPVMSAAQSLSLDWVQTEPYGVHNSSNTFLIDPSTKDIVSEVGAWMDQINSVHANALNRRNTQGQMVCDSLFDNNSYLDYMVRGFYPKNGETYYCLNYQSSILIFEKVNTAGQLVWTSQIPRANLFFPFDRNLKGNNYVIDDSLNNRMLWMFEQLDASFTTKSIGILATDNTTGAITVIDTLNHPLSSTYANYPVELQRDNNNHVYMSVTDHNAGMQIYLLDNGQLTSVMTGDSAGVRDFAQSMRIVGNTMFVSSQIEVSNSNSINKLRIYSIDNAGQLTLISEQNMYDTQHYILSMKTFGNHCYVFTGGYTNSSYPSLVPTVWKYDNAGSLVSTFTLPAFAATCMNDIAITNTAIYCSMYAPNYNMLEVIDPVMGMHLTSYPLLSEFTAIGNDGVFQLEAYAVNPGRDVVFANGNQWISNTNLFGRLAKYVYDQLKTGTEETVAEPLISIFPNPASDQLFVNCTGSGYTLEITDAAGKLVVSQKVNTPQQVIDLSAFNSGVYFIRCSDAEKVIVRRFVKE